MGENCSHSSFVYLLLVVARALAPQVSVLFYWTRPCFPGSKACGAAIDFVMRVVVDAAAACVLLLTRGDDDDDDAATTASCCHDYY